ncbi:N-acetylglucosamine-6-phosphate deacetylase [Halobacteroides halobius DSM 5150]|uniref:N-acetylglucosamine-6-phosphate deacetylase n=1 Tax=Halobacteroides halobius (strain ATCC 35273 / DSM 5150 / MD-1) TaxID=748449 RepID=L0K8T5_HALHC|nr:N-acetylglucosamine-6-phosphate deacetylase [Halobacteroides halobius]AGB40764.1 N-acetylglucosamine-6-phosphate deacetylase [Halobacteroides halobius DSM 5150]
MNSLLLKKGRIITEDKIIKNGFVRIKDGVIKKIGQMSKLNNINQEQVIDLKGDYLAPGFIDIHIHGAKGQEVMNGNKEAFSTIANYKASKGTTGFLATTLTASQEKLIDISQSLVSYIKSEEHIGNMLGLHLEGPYINPDKKGAQNPDYIKEPSIEELATLVDILGDKLKIITLAPENNNSKEVINYALENNIVVSAGHTNASWEQMQKAFEWGVSHATHLFNGMKGLYHREPGVVGAFLNSNDTTVELIVDKEHIHPAVINLVLQNKNFEDIILITDAMAATGMGDGEYNLGGLEVIIKSGVARLKSGNLASSTIDLKQAVKNVIEITELNLVEAIKLATINPARRLNIANQKGSIEVGKDGDLVVFDDQFNTQMTIIEGEIVYNKLIS